MRLVHGYRSVRECYAASLHECQKLDQSNLPTCAELCAVQFRRQIVNVENDFRSEDLWNHGAEYKKIGHRMDVHNRIAISCVLEANSERRMDKESQVAQEVSQTVVAAVPSYFQVQQSNACQDFAGRIVLLFQAEEVHGIAPCGKCFRLSSHSRVVLIICVRNHSDVHVSNFCP